MKRYWGYSKMYQKCLTSFDLLIRAVKYLLNEKFKLQNSNSINHHLDYRAEFCRICPVFIDRLTNNDGWYCHFTVFSSKDLESRVINGILYIAELTTFHSMRILTSLFICLPHVRLVTYLLTWSSTLFINF